VEVLNLSWVCSGFDVLMHVTGSTLDKSTSHGCWIALCLKLVGGCMIHRFSRHFLITVNWVLWLVGSKNAIASSSEVMLHSCLRYRADSRF
jgi:hypothetical protein